ncbi:MAG: integrase arm-type DNA-binding domain-containing protein [Alteraurantiacibacter sp.]
MGNLTASGIKNLKKPGRYSDGEGLILKFRGSGKGSWILRVQKKGKRQDIGLGKLSEVNLSQARTAARKLRKDFHAGVDVFASRKEGESETPTFRAAAYIVHEEHKAAWKNGKHQTQWIRTLETYAFPKLGDRLVSDIAVPLIRDTLAPIWLTKPETARRVRQRIGSVLDWACAKGFRDSEAPMRSVMRGLPRQQKKPKHHAAMPYPEIPQFLVSLRKRSSVGRLALEFLILTAARSGEVRGATWNEVDLTKKLWTIPAERMKAGSTHVVPLSGAAIAVLQRARQFRSTRSDLIFPGQVSRREMSDMTLLKILRDKGEDFTVHGFRSSFRDWAAEKTNYPGELAEAALAHTIANRVEAAYRRTDYIDKRRPMMEDWAKFCAGK